MKNIINVILISSAFAAAGAVSTLAPLRLEQPPAGIAADIMEKCDSIGRVECGKKCADGWEIIGYYRSDDKGKDGTAAKTIVAMQTTAICERCFVRFTVRKDGTFREVACESFYDFISSENSRCKNCLTPVMLPLFSKQPSE